MLQTAKHWKEKINSGELKEQLRLLYGESAEKGGRGIFNLLDSYAMRFGDSPCALFSASGRTELSGNHTDHQHGCVLCAAVMLDMTAAAAPREDTRVCVLSEGFGEICVDISDLTIHENEKGSSAALIRGVAKAMSKRGTKLRGFDAYIRSNVPQGSGLSSSAAYEVLIGEIFNELFSCGFTPTELAQFGQYAENKYFGKPCGLMDQMASALGGVVFIDFFDPAAPRFEQLDLSFEKYGYSICITNAGGSHADLTDEYAAITSEMLSVARYFGKDVLREVDEKEFFAALPALRKTVTDRALLRAMHYFSENNRVELQLKALKNGSIDDYLTLMESSGRSSMAMLQNVWASGCTQERSLSLALAVSDSILNGDGVSRVHGGGFAGTIQALVPSEKARDYKNEMDRVFGEEACHIMAVRPVGAYRIK